MKVLLLILGTILGILGAKFIYDARELTNQFFFGKDKNKNVLILRVLGFAFIIIDILVVYFLM